MLVEPWELSSVGFRRTGGEAAGAGAKDAGQLGGPACAHGDEAMAGRGERVGAAQR